MSFLDKGSMPCTAMVSRDPDRSGNFVCDGSNDEVEIVAAFFYITILGGGVVHLGIGIFTLGAPIDFPANELTLEGEGRNTLIDGDALLTNQNAIRVLARTNCTIRNLSVQTNAGGTLTISCIYTLNANQFLIDEVIVEASDTNGILCEISVGLIKNCYITGADDRGINWAQGNVDVVNCEITDCNDGVYIGVGAGANQTSGSVIDCNIYVCARDGITVSGENIVDLRISFNIIDTVIRFSIRIADSTTVDQGHAIISNYITGGSNGISVEQEGIRCNIRIIGNIVTNNVANASGIRVHANSIIIAENHLESCQRNGIILDRCEKVVVKENICINNGQGSPGGTFTSGILLWLQGAVECQKNIVSNNICYDTQETQTQFDGIWLVGAKYNIVNGNICINNSDAQIRLDAEANLNQIKNNYLETGAYGIRIDDADCNNNVIQGNRFNGNVTLAVWDKGTDNIYDQKVFQFTEAIVGDIITTAPTGVDVDATTEGALAWGQIPAEAQQVMKIKIWAVATDGPIAAGGYMHLETIFNAGASNAAYNTANKSWTLPNFNGEEVDYVANDIVHWLIERGDVGNELDNLVAGDRFEIFAMWEVGDDPDGATDCLFSTVEIEYV